MGALDGGTHRQYFGGIALEDRAYGLRPEAGHLAPRELMELHAADSQSGRAGPVETAERLQRSDEPGVPGLS
jgi:hypothetical protein